MLGFEPYELESLHRYRTNSSYVPDPCAFCRILMVYSDVAKQQIASDLLNVVNVSEKYGEVVCPKCIQLHYLPNIRNNRFDYLEMAI